MKLICLDIDDTQLPDRNRGVGLPGEEKAIAALKAELERLRETGEAIVMHITNGIYPHFQDVRDQLADADYLSCTASTELRTPNGDGEYGIEDEHRRRIDGLGYDPAAARAIGEGYDALEILGPEHLGQYKMSFMFREDVDEAQRQKILADITRRAGEELKGTEVHYVEGHGEYYIDFLPPNCTKGDNIAHVAAKHGIAAGDIMVFGNGNNDISMFRKEFTCVAVGNSSDALREHVEKLQRETGDTKRYRVNPGVRAQSVLQALKPGPKAP